jgi:hypothetical protein
VGRTNFAQTTFTSNARSRDSFDSLCEEDSANAIVTTSE